MRSLKYLFVLLCILPFVSAEHIVINEVFYNPVGTDTGKEFVELYNPTEEIISLKDYVLESGNGANPNDWTVEWTGSNSDSISPKGYFLVGEVNVSPSPNIVTDLDLQNSPDGVRIRRNQTIVDTVGYGSLQFPEYFESAPATNVPEGSSLSRTSGIDTDNNSADFKQAEPTPQLTQQNSLAIQINVVEPALEISSVQLSDEDPAAPGTQVIPVAGGSKRVNLTATIYDSQGFGNSTSVTATVANRQYSLSRVASNATSQKYSGFILLSVTDPAGNYTIELAASSGGKTGSRQLSFEYMPITAILVDTSLLNVTAQPNTLIQVIGDLDMSTRQSSTVKNIGNVDIDVGVKGSALVSSKGTIAPENIELAFGSSFGLNSVTLSTSLQILPLRLKSDVPRELSYRIFVPQGTAPSAYKGFVLITARSS